MASGLRAFLAIKYASKVSCSVMDRIFCSLRLAIGSMLIAIWPNSFCACFLACSVDQKQFIVRKINKSIFELRSSSSFSGKEIEKVNGIFNSIKDADQAIDDDKVQFSMECIYFIAEFKEEDRAKVMKVDLNR